ncbi:MAG: hypothetical protein ACYC6T_07955 [Thermoleophilia bacterium]
MPEERTERTTYQGLLALMLVAADSESWGFPYWNSLLLDAALQGLAQAPRDGTAHLTAPALAPTTALVTSGGTLAAGQTLEVVQTFVDAFGRETLAGLAASQSTGTPITDPAAAVTFGAITPAGAGYEGGLFEIWFSWTDGSGGETLPSPVATTDLPYLAGGLLSEVVVDLPSTPAVAGAVGANIYARHRSGNVVLAYQILVDTVSQATLTGVAADCYRTLPLANSTYSSRALDITGQAANGGESPSLTRFYLRPSGATWSAGDRRLKLAGVDEWNPATVIYPLRYTGATSELAPGYPPSVSQVKAIRPVDLAAGESVGLLPVAQLPPETVLEAELIRSTGEGIIAGLSVSAHAPADMGVRVIAGEALLFAGRFQPAQTDLVVPMADPGNPRIDLVILNSAGVAQGPSEDGALKGIPAVAPAAPALPAGALGLAQVLVGTGVTTIVAGAISDTRDLIPTVQSLEATTWAHIADAIAHLSAGEHTTFASHVAPDALLHFTGTEKADRLLSALQKTDLTDGGESALHTHAGIGSAGYTTAATNHLAIAAKVGQIQDLLGELFDLWPGFAVEWLELTAMVDEMHQIMATSRRRSFTDIDRAVTAGPAVDTDFTIGVLAEGTLTQLDLVFAGTTPDFTLALYRDAARTVLVKSWANVTASPYTSREFLDWINEAVPQAETLYVRVTNNTANAVTLTTTVTIKED